MEESRWNDELLLILDLIPPKPEEFENLDVDAQTAAVIDLGFNTHHIQANGVKTGEAGICFYHTQHALQQRSDKLKAYHDVYKKNGINDIVYLNVHWLDKVLMETKPEWFQKDAGGENIVVSYGTGGYACVNSSFKDWVCNIISDLGSYGIKGIFLDGPVFNPAGCYCSSCMSEFEKRYGFCFTPSNLKDIHILKKFLDFKQDCLVEFLRDAEQALKKVNKNAVIYMNSVQLGPNVCSRNNRKTIKWQDALLAEGGVLYSDLRTIPIWKPAASAKLLETQSDGKPYIVALSGRVGPWNRYLLNPAEMWLLYALSISNGAGIWFCVYDSNRNDKGMMTVKEINRFLSANTRYLSGTSSIAKIAVVWSYKNANFYQSTSDYVEFVGEKKTIENNLKNDARAAVHGWLEVLHRSHRLFDIIDDYYVENEDLSKYELVILPGIACMSRRESEIIKSYVENGGHIVLTYDTGFYNEIGMSHGEFLLKEIAGISKIDGMEELKFDHIEIENGCFGGGIEKALIPAPKLHLNVIPSEGAECCLSYRGKQPGNYCDLPPKTGYPFMLANNYGKGKSVMFTGNVDTLYNNYCFSEYFTIMDNALDLLSTREVIASEELVSLIINTRKKGDTHIVHLVNHTSYGGRPITKVIPLHDVKISLYIEKKPASVKTLRSGLELDYEYGNGLLTFAVPEIHEYEIVVCE